MQRPFPRLSLTLCLTALCAAACSESEAAEAQKEVSGPTAVVESATKAIPLPDEAPLEAWRVELIELAMDAATAFPLHPHVKNRSMAQESVVEACIALEQPRRALAYAERIPNWRRGVGYAALAEHLARGGTGAGVDQLIALAEVESRLERETNPQDWQRDLIRSKIAAALLLLGRAGDAQPFEQGLEASESGRVDASKAALLEREAVEARLAELEGLIATGNLDQLRSGLQVAIELYERAFDDRELRARCVDWIARSTPKVPPQVRLEACLELSRRATARGDGAESLAQVARAREVLDGSNWLPEDLVPLTGRVAAARAAAGDAKSAAKEAAEAEAIFQRERERIQDFWRGAALRPLAEAWAALGEREQALRVYRLAAEEGLHNPNARPRCEDLVATCLSMARNGIEPDVELEARLRAARAGLGDPW